jgi:hypothetical protein
MILNYIQLGKDFMIQQVFVSANRSIYSIQFDRTKWDWNININNFKWEEGVTPMSNFGVIILAWCFYFITLMALKSIMKTREPFKLKFTTAIHNLILSVASLAMTISGIYSIYTAIQVFLVLI